MVIIESSSRTMIQKHKSKSTRKLTQNQTQSPDLNLWTELKRGAREERRRSIREDLGLWMIWRDCLKRNGLRFPYSTSLLDVTEEHVHAVQGRLYNVLNAGVPIKVLLKIFIS